MTQSNDDRRFGDDHYDDVFVDGELFTPERVDDLEAFLREAEKTDGSRS
jgi:hypothetical protein